MTAPSPERACPSCDSKDIENVHQDKHICKECNLVIDGYDKSIEPVSTKDATDSSDSPANSSNQRWAETVTAQDSSEESLIQMISTTEELVTSLNGDTDARVQAAELLTKSWEQQYFRGRSADAGIAAVVYATFRQLKEPRPLAVVAQAGGVSNQQLRTGYQSLRKNTSIDMKLASRASYIPFLIEHLSLDQEIEQQARSIQQSAPEVTGNPAGIAAACVYLATQAQESTITLADAGGAAGVAKETVWLKTRDIKNSGSF